MLILSRSFFLSQPTVVQWMRQAFPNIIQADGYGLTETLGGIMWDFRATDRATVRLRDVSELGYFVTDLPHPRGEVLVQSRSMSRGYYRNPDATRQAFLEDGWFATGDVAEIQDVSLYIINISNIWNIRNIRNIRNTINIRNIRSIRNISNSCSSQESPFQTMVLFMCLYAFVVCLFISCVFLFFEKTGQHSAIGNVVKTRNVCCSQLCRDLYSLLPSSMLTTSPSS